MSDSVDVIVIGSGHNGLTTACYLAKAGYKVRVFERRDTLGERFAPRPCLTDTGWMWVHRPIS